MPLHIVVGGQLGSEGKGKVALSLAREFRATFAVKTSGTNAGHTVYDSSGKKYIFRVLPSASVISGMKCVFPAGCYLDPDLLFKEMGLLGFDPRNIFIHPNAGIITKDIKAQERSSGLCHNIGSTGSGTGYATLHRTLCDGSFVSASMIPELRQFICDTSELLRGALDLGAEVIVEGCQGFGLSLLHTPWYPYCTSRDTTASAFLSEVGLSPFDVKTVAMVLRTYPIRVAGNSGPLPNETTWEQVTRDARSETPIVEFTSVTRNKRKVAYFDEGMVRDAVIANNPNIVVMNFMDYIWDENPNVVGPNRRAFLDRVEGAIGVRITHLGFDGNRVVPYNRD